MMAHSWSTYRPPHEIFQSHSPSQNAQMDSGADWDTNIVHHLLFCLHTDGIQFFMLNMISFLVMRSIWLFESMAN